MVMLTPSWHDMGLDRLINWLKVTSGNNTCDICWHFANGQQLALRLTQMATESLVRYYFMGSFERNTGVHRPKSQANILILTAGRLIKKQRSSGCDADAIIAILPYTLSQNRIKLSRSLETLQLSLTAYSSQRNVLNDPASVFKYCFISPVGTQNIPLIVWRFSGRSVCVCVAQCVEKGW